VFRTEFRAGIAKRFFDSKITPSIHTKSYWKRSLGVSGIIFRAEVQSPSALLIHSLVIGFIHNLSAFQNFADERISHCQPSRYLLRRSNEQIKCHPRLDSASDCDRLPVGCPLERHDHEQINIRVPLRGAIRVRAEEYDLLRTELARNLAADAFDLGGRFLEGVVSWSRHVTQLLVLLYPFVKQLIRRGQVLFTFFRINCYAFAVDPF
jgi:hypothetical protein